MESTGALGHQAKITLHKIMLSSQNPDTANSSQHLDMHTLVSWFSCTIARANATLLLKAKGRLAKAAACRKRRLHELIIIDQPLVAAAAPNYLIPNEINEPPLLAAAAPII